MSGLNKIKYGHTGFLPAADELNQKIIEGFLKYSDEPVTHKTHFFEGRYENIYIDREKIPEMHQIIEQAIAYAAEILAIEEHKLQCGFWFNSMNSGDMTKAHTHDDDDELLSGVYYVEVPENSGQLCLGVGNNQIKVDPEAGKVVFFSPALIHEVTPNLSDRHRLSIGMNFGLKEEFKSE